MAGFSPATCLREADASLRRRQVHAFLLAYLPYAKKICAFRKMFHVKHNS
jgi:hypothetical protein